jgi:hypothetical protein
VSGIVTVLILHTYYWVLCVHCASVFVVRVVLLLTVWYIVIIISFLGNEVWYCYSVLLLLCVPFGSQILVMQLVSDEYYCYWCDMMLQ